jgi:hypothetical protein
VRVPRWETRGTVQQRVKLGVQIELLAFEPKASEHEFLPNRMKARLSYCKLGSGGIALVPPGLRSGPVVRVAEYRGASCHGAIVLSSCDQ